VLAALIPAFCGKVVDGLRAAVGDGARVELEDGPGDRVGGVVLSGSFATLSPGERQDLIWRHLDDNLTPFERTRITFIVTDTPEEYETLRKAAGE
jgi:hypothetical protein